MGTKIFTVEITTEAGQVTSRFFQTLRGARRWAMWCEKTWPTRIMQGGQGGKEVPVRPASRALVARVEAANA